MYAEDDNDFVRPANDTIQLNCTKVHTGNITWFHNDKRMESAKTERVLEVTVGEF